MANDNFGVPPQPSPSEVADVNESPEARQVIADGNGRLGLMLALSPLLGAGSCLMAGRFGGILWLLTVALAVAGVFFGVKAVVNGAVGSRGRNLGAAAIVIGILAPLSTAFVGFFTMVSRGRALRRRGIARHPRIGPRDGWTSRPTAETQLPPAAVQAWLANARTEVASVAAFNHLGNQLLAVGAPSSLIRGALRASLEEIDHAELCFAIAGHPAARGVVSFPEAESSPDRKTTFVSLAVDCIVEACYLERASALVAARLAALPIQDTRIREVLRTIARDEASHAEHGFDVLQFALASDPKAAVAARKALVIALENPVAPPVHTDALEEHGIAGPETWSNALRDAGIEAMERLDALTAAPGLAA
jgi:hypothetical protein